MESLSNWKLIKEWYIPCTLRCTRRQEYECCQYRYISLLSHQAERITTVYSMLRNQHARATASQALCHFRVEFGTCVECEPTSIVPIFQTSTRGAGSVVVSASDWHAGGPGLIHRRNEPVLFGITNNRQRLTMLKCATGGAMLCATHIGIPPT